MAPMNRREAVLAMGLVAAGSLVACAPDASPRAASDRDGRVLSPADEALAEAIADTLLPTTAASPGAKAAGAGAAINLLISDCYPADAQRRFTRGLAAIRATCRARHGGEFASLGAADREALLRAIDAGPPDDDPHQLALLRELALRAYFGSEVGMTQALRYPRVPGRWVGCVPLAPGQPAWG